MLFIEYPKCTTCQKARKWLEAQGVSLELPEANQHKIVPHQDGPLHQHPVGGQQGKLLFCKSPFRVPTSPAVQAGLPAPGRQPVGLELRQDAVNAAQEKIQNTAEFFRSDCCN